MAEEPARTIELNFGDGEGTRFDSYVSFSNWISNEATVWRELTELAVAANSPTDALQQAAVKRAGQHDRQWQSWNQKLQDVLSLDDVQAHSLAANQIRDAVVRGVQTGSVVISSSPLGIWIHGLARSESIAACIALSLSVKGLAQFMGREHDLAEIFRSLCVVHSSSLGMNGDQLIRGMADSAGRAAEAAAHAMEKRVEVDDLVLQAREALNNEERLRAESLSTFLTEQESTATNQASSIAREWVALKKRFAEELALEAPVNYWTNERTRTLRQAAIWLVLTAALVIASAALIPRGSVLLNTAKASASAGAGLLGYLPELLVVGVVAFLLLWGLRISTRQFVENLARAEEASVRVTMTQTYLALANPQDGQNSLVEAADRAVIIQALFRPSAHLGIDDAPPAHWIEDVFRRVREGTKKS